MGSGAIQSSTQSLVSLDVPAPGPDTGARLWLRPRGRDTL